MNNIEDFETGESPPNKFGRLNLSRAPKPREVYWCRYPADACVPEFWKKRPVVIVSRNATLRSAVTVLPLTTHEQDKNEWALNLGGLLTAEKTTWVVCNHPATLSTARLNPTGRHIIKIDEDDFGKALKLLDRHIIRPA